MPDYAHGRCLSLNRRIRPFGGTVMRLMRRLMSGTATRSILSGRNSRAELAVLRAAAPQLPADRLHSRTMKPIRSRGRNFANIALALAAISAVSPSLAQVDNWGGDVKVSEISLSIAPGETTSYSVRLNMAPGKDGTPIPVGEVWTVMVSIDGVRYQDGKYKDLTLIPSFYRTFDGTDWNKWKDFQITRVDEEDWDVGDDGPRATSVTFTHEVWDHGTNCPVHGRGSVEVSIDLSGGNNNGGNGGNGGNGDNGDNGGGGNGGGGNGGGGNNGGGGTIKNGGGGTIKFVGDGDNGDENDGYGGSDDDSAVALPQRILLA